MTRALYRFLVRLHPPAFRREYSGEMLWIFDEMSAAQGVSRLFADGFLSLARQWLIRQGVWKILAAAVGGLLYISLALRIASPSIG
jgi:hypothetical protein